ncbi:MAG: hypothetical protein R3C03_18045 [Pirellulaceae bacterium]
MNSKNHSLPISVLLFNILSLAAGSIAATQTRNWEFVFYVLVVLVLGLLVAWVHRNVGLPIALLWALSLWAVLHMAGGLVPIPESWHESGKPVLYSWMVIPGVLRYDQPTHAYGFGVATWLVWVCLTRSLRARPESIGTVAIAALAGLGLGATNEVIEFFASLTMDTNVGGYINTGWDLVFNTIGSVIAAMVIFLRKKMAANQTPAKRVESD